MLNDKIKKYLLSVARATIALKLGVGGAEMQMPRGEEAQVLNEKRGVFVTLEIGGRLRGCIGHIVGVLPL
ncbi:MAG: AMMECR1 domain-containing protein, partial [Candidatus Gracilibacteria bacterium]